MPLPPAAVEVVVDGLFAPMNMAALPDGGLLIAEAGTGERDDSAGVTLLTADGAIGRLVSGLPSSRDSGDLAGVSLVSFSPDSSTIFIGSFGAGHLWTLPLTAGERTSGLALPPEPYRPEQLGQAMAPLSGGRLVNPFDMTYDVDGKPVVSYSDDNGVAIETIDGATRFVHRSEELPNPELVTGTVEAVPTGITRIGGEYYVSLTNGCPFPTGAGQIVAVDLDRSQRTVLDGLNMPVDVAIGPDGSLWVLEFARVMPNVSCLTREGYQVKSGRLSRLAPGCLTAVGVRADCALETILDDLNYPGALLPMEDGSLYISEVFPGRILRITFGEQNVSPTATEELTAADMIASTRRDYPTTEYDVRLSSVILDHGLLPRPGHDVRGGDTAVARLGQALFFDPILSGDRNISCATCHHPRLAMADGRALPIGAGGSGLGPGRTFVQQVQLGGEAGEERRQAGRTDVASGVTVVHNPFVGQFVARNSPTILNSALLPLQFWDGRVESYASKVKTKEHFVNTMELTDPLAAQALFPMTSLHEMAGATLGGLAPQDIRRALIERLRANPTYVQLFQDAYGPAEGKATDAITIERMVAALAAFERRFIYTDSSWDAYLDGEPNALTEQQKRGALLFFGVQDPAVNCSACHSGDLFTDMQFHNLLSPQLGPGKGNGYLGREDWGRAGVTFDARDRYAFRTPSLRNVTLTAPYFHSGAFATLEAAIWHHADIVGSAANYDPSANGIPPDLYSSVKRLTPERQLDSVDPLLAGKLALTEQDVAGLVAFLASLTDPAARNLDDFLVSAVPSGLPLDPLPAYVPVATTKPARLAPIAAEPPAEVAAADGMRLRNTAVDRGLRFPHGAFRTDVFADPVAAMGGGLCWIDFDADGWLDLYVVNSYAEDERTYWQVNGGLPHNALFRNVGGTFVDVSRGSGADLTLRGNGCVAADFNGDERMDLYVTAYGPNALLWNNGDGTFTDGAAAAGVAAEEWSTAAAVGDLNGDGLPDLYVGGYIDFDRKIPKPVGAFPQDYYGIPDRLYLNRGPASPGSNTVLFQEVTVAAGLTNEERGLGAILSDLDGDGDLDLYVANDGHPNRLYRNEQWPGGLAADPAKLGFRFADATQAADVGDTGSGMGVAIGDYDGDGRYDLFITNWEREYNALYRNTIDETAELTFQYSTFRIGLAGLGSGITGWGAQLADLDNDTDNDLLFVNGRVPVTNLATDPEYARYYRNLARAADGNIDRPGRFLDWTEQVGLEEAGPFLARGSAIADFDNDGDLDVAVNQIAGDLVLLENSGVAGNWLQIRYDGFYPGASATVVLPDGHTLVGEVHAGSSYLASEDPRLHFGLGQVTTIPQVTVRWPDGIEITLTGVAANQTLLVEHPVTTLGDGPETAKVSPYPGRVIAFP